MSRVVVGVGDPPASAAVVGFAFGEAARHGVPLLAIRAGTPPRSASRDDLDATLVPRDPAVRERYERSLLRDALAGSRSEHPNVPVVTRIKSGDIATTLTRACRTNDLLVIGHRHAGRFYPPALGPISSQIVHHARCSLVVVPIITAPASRRTPTSAATSPLHQPDVSPTS